MSPQRDRRPWGQAATQRPVRSDPPVLTGRSLLPPSATVASLARIPTVDRLKTHRLGNAHGQSTPECQALAQVSRVRRRRSERPKQPSPLVGLQKCGRLAAAVLRCLCRSPVQMRPGSVGPFNPLGTLAEAPAAGTAVDGRAQSHDTDLDGGGGRSCARKEGCRPLLAATSSQPGCRPLLAATSSHPARLRRHRGSSNSVPPLLRAPGVTGSQAFKSSINEKWDDFSLRATHGGTARPNPPWPPEQAST